MIIVFEGSNGSGTSTQVNIFSKLLPDYIATRHPGSTNLGKELRKMLKFGSFSTTPTQELLLFAADAMSFYEEYIVKNKYENILCDRINFIGMMTYQKANGATDNQIGSTVKAMMDLEWKTIIDKIFIFDAPYDVLKSRIEKPDLIEQDKEQGNRKDRFESKGDEYMRKVCNSYSEICGMTLPFAKEIIRIDATKSVEEVTDQIKSYL